MIRVDLEALFNHLNAESRLALEQASSLCISQQGGEVTVAHWLFTLLDNPVGDFRMLLKYAGIDTDEVRQALASAFVNQRENINQYPSFSPLLIEMIQEAWTLGSMELGHQQIRSGVLVLATLLNSARYLPLAAIQIFEPINREALRKDFNKLFAETSEQPAQENKTSDSKNVVSEAESALKKFGHDFTEQARQGRIDPVLCRDVEIDQMIDILTRRRKNNPIVVGDAGVGKSALVEGLALRIVEDRVPKLLQGVALWGLDLGALQAGAAVKGEFEKRLKAVIDEVKNSPRPMILFIDEAHTLIGAGNAAGGSDAANLLKPALARGELRTIAATTWSEYKKYFEKDPALSRRFQLVKVNEPTLEQAVHIMRGLRNTYEQAHHVYISDDAILAAVDMSARFLSGRQLPDKAIDVLDTASARVATALAEPPRRLSAFEHEEQQIRSEFDLLERDRKMGRKVDASRLDYLSAALVKVHEKKIHLEQAWQKQKSLVEDILALRAQITENEAAAKQPDETAQQTRAEQTASAQAAEHSAEPAAEPAVAAPTDTDPTTDTNTHTDTPAAADATSPAPQATAEEANQDLAAKVEELAQLQQRDALVHADVGKEQIAQVIADWTGIPATTISHDRMERLKRMPAILAERVKGQDVAIDHIHRHLLTSTADLRRPGTPLGVFLLVGPSGVGKTEAARVIADEFFGGLQFLTSINMSEYQEKHTVSRLLGSPPGYVGYGEGGILTEAIRQKPYSVVLLDEVEKAHPEVLNIFYQAFDKGEIADGEGRLIDCKNILFFLTSNIGFDSVDDGLQTPDQTELRKKLMQFFKPALLARMQVVPFNHLDEDVLAQIVDMRLTAISKQVFNRYKANLEVLAAAKDELKSRCIRHENGARMLDASIDGELLPPLSMSILQQLATGETFTKATLDWDGQNFTAIIENSVL
ncbi:type VI secretion system ATPase TssH [Saezia sanguinis]|uniref:type VI secretion system ATPase TssH n=1 Tax=Saezia sanguinis TaxID=1965230 RepID=UPI0030637145